jgi:hypothetical protein
MDLDENEGWPRLLALDQLSLVELPGIEPAALPGLLLPYLPVLQGVIAESPRRCALRTPQRSAISWACPRAC